MTKILKVGITGGIGSGKSTVCRIFETLGIPVYYADDRAKKLMTEDEQVTTAVKTLFGPEAYLPTGALNRELIGKIVFSDSAKLRQLNSIVHPAVHRDGIEWHEKQAGVPYTLKEAALIFESGSYAFLDRIITVFAPESLRLERVMARDQASAASIKARMDKQMPEEQKVSRSDFVIYNNESQLLIPQVLAIHRALLQEATA